MKTYVKPELSVTLFKKNEIFCGDVGFDSEEEWTWRFDPIFEDE